MARKRAPQPETNPSIGAEARQLLALMARQSGLTVSAVLESAIREKAEREKVTLPGQTAGNGAHGGPATGSPVTGPTSLDLRPLAGRAAAGDAAAAEEIQRIVAELRAAAAVLPAKSPDELEPEWQDRLLALAAQVQCAVPGEWTEEELQEQIAQSIAEVRAGRAGDH